MNIIKTENTYFGVIKMGMTDWIKVTDKLPEREKHYCHSDIVLFFKTDYDDHYYLGRYFIEENTWYCKDDEDNAFPVKNVSHWALITRPIDAPPVRPLSMSFGL